MSLIKCEECGGQVSDKAERCPHCGYPVMPEPTQELLINYPKKEIKSNITPYAVKQKKSIETENIDELYKAAIGDTSLTYYLKAFHVRQQDASGDYKIGWNWPAFLVTGLWLLYRKLYIHSIIYIFICSLVNILLKPVNDNLSILCLIFISLIYSLLANSIYKKNIDKKIESSEIACDTFDERIKYLRKHGGTNTALVLVFFFIVCVGIMLAIIIPQMNQ